MMRALGAFAVIGLAAAAYYFLAPADVVSSEFDAQQDDIAALVDDNDPKEALRLFKDRYSLAPVTSQHQAAHIFGESLYEKEGLKGFSVCDDSFGFGCFHSFISLAIVDHGEKVAVELDRLCVESYGPEGLGCSHGIGHGLLSHYGYDTDALASALSLCGKLTWKREYGGCQDGAFMEYDFRTMADDAGNKLRVLSDAEPLEPCPEVDAEFRVACYFGLPSWWAASFAGPGAEVKMAAWCDRISVREEKRACYRGIGYGIGPSANFDHLKLLGACQVLPDKEGELWCREGAAWMLYARPESRHLAEYLCTEGLPQSDAERCKEEYLFVIQS